MSARRRFLLIAVLVSVAVHVAAALLILLLPRVLPGEARPQEQGMIELLMVEQKGSSAAAPKQESSPAPPQPSKQQEAAKPETPSPKPQVAAPPEAAPPVADPADEPATPSAVTTPRQEAMSEPGQSAPPPPAPPPKAAEAPVFVLAGTESESNAEALGGQILPASPDNRFRNKPPIYPDEAAIRGEHGSVLLLIHVSEAGIATRVDVVQGSGVASLDQAAVTAVRKWRFHPALREGQTVPFDMPFRIVFQAN